MEPDVRYVRSGDASLAYLVVGNGPPDILLIWGFLSNIEYAWHYPSLAAFLSRLAEFSRLILVDRRGSGLSDRFWDPPTFETTLRDLEVVLDEVGSPKTSLIGVWDGCAAAVLFAATRPDRVSSLVLFGSSPAQLPKDDYDAGWEAARWDEWLRSIRDGWGTRAWVVQNARWMGPSMLDDPDELERWITYTRLSASPSAAEAVMRNSMDTDIRDVLPIVQAPTLVLHRTGDQIEEIRAGRYVADKIPGARFVELAGDDGIPWLGDVGSVTAEIDAFVRGGPTRGPDPRRRLGTVLFTDIVGSTEHLVSLGDAEWRRRMAEHDTIARREIHRANGRWVDAAGDGIFATFDGPAAAVRCAQAIGDAIRPLDLRIRAGSHTGELEADGDRVRGITVHVGARVMALAGPSEVWVTQTLKDLVAGSGLAFEDAGEHELKGIPDRWRLYRVVAA